MKQVLKRRAMPLAYRMIMMLALLSNPGSAWAADDFQVATDRVMSAKRLVINLRLLEKEVSGPCLDRYCTRMGRIRQELAQLRILIEEAIAQTRGTLKWTQEMAGYNNDAAWEQYTKRIENTRLGGNAETWLAVSDALLDFSDIITGDLSKLAGAVSVALRESGLDTVAGNVAGGAITGGAGDYGVFARVERGGQAGGAGSKTGASGKPAAKILRESLQGALKGAVGTMITAAFRKAGIDDESVLGELARETVNQMAGMLVDKLTAATGETVEFNPYVIGGVLVKAAGAAVARQQIRKARSQLAEVYKTMDKFEKKRVFFIRQWKLHSGAWKALKQARALTQKLLDETGKLRCPRLAALSHRVDDSHPVPDWRRKTPDPDPALIQAHRVLEDLLAFSSGIGQCWVGGQVVDKDNRPVPDARVILELGGQRYVSRSDARGAFRFTISKDYPLPMAVSLTARKKGYAAGSTTVLKREFEHVEIMLPRQSGNIIDIEPELHHLGDGHFSGQINSQFQKPEAEALEIKRRFTIPKALAFDVHRQPVVTMEAKGLEEKNPVLLNGKQVALLASSNASGAASRIELPIDACVLRAGENELIVRSVDSDGNGDMDDFEIANIQLQFRPVPMLSSVQGAKMTSLDSVRILVGNPGKPAKDVAVDERFSIEGKGKGECAVRPDLAVVFVFPLSGGEEAGKKLTLVETGPDTGLFRTEQPLKPGDIPVAAGDKLVVRAGVRAASVMVTQTAEALREQAERQNLLDEVARAEREYDVLRKQWKQLSDVIDEQRAVGRNVDDLMANLHKLTVRIQKARARVIDARRKAGLETGPIHVGGQRWTGGPMPSKP